jgi:hypothetical protein
MATPYGILILAITTDAEWRISDIGIDYLQGAATVTYFLKTVFSCSRSSFVKAQSFESKSPK